MVGFLKDVSDAQKGLSFYQCVETMRSLSIEFQSQTKKDPLSHRKIVPVGLFCMSGPVAHADDEEDEDADPAKKNTHEKSGLKSSDNKPRLIRKVMYMNLVEKDPSSETGEKTSMQDTADNGLHASCLIKQNCANGCTFEGNWLPDQQGGRGKISWPSGSTYEGDVVNGSLHGVGTYKGSDGTIYKGHWRMNKKQGFGWKHYANEDVYEGTWKWDVPHGQGRYTWSNGSEYYGEWKHGLMSGRGVLVWSSGDNYDGHWYDGLADGHGVYTWADGSTYFGTWRKGLRCGAGRFFPPGSKYLQSDSFNYAFIEEDYPIDGDLEHSCRQKVCSPSHVPQELRRSGLGFPTDELSLGVVSSPVDICRDKGLALETLWTFENSAALLPSINAFTQSNKCVSEESDENFSYGEDLSVSEGDLTHSKWLTEDRKRLGEIVFKGHRNYHLMTSLQLGIRHSVGKMLPASKNKLVPGDFGSKARTKLSFPREGSQVTTCHQAGAFRWKDYRPTVFRQLRELFKIDPADYMLSLCGDNALRELPSPGKSGSVFYLTQDERFIIKTLKKTEVKVLLKMMPRYYNHVRANANTLLTRFFGLHRFQNANGQKVRVIIMGNVVASDSWIHRRFDLKGSSQGRTVEKGETDESTTLKDLDLEFVFQLDQPWRDMIMAQISKDCKFLESEHIMDYSLLLGLHFKDPLPTEMTDSYDSAFNLPLHDVVLSRFLAESGGFVEVEVIPKQHSTKSSELGHIEFLKGQSLLIAAEDETIESGSFSVVDKMERPQIGHNVPARAHRRLANGKVDTNSKETFNVLLYFGVIDILQEYDMGKKLEHAYKSFQFDSLSISAVDPVVYSNRFQQFLHEIFPA